MPRFFCKSQVCVRENSGPLLHGELAEERMVHFSLILLDFAEIKKRKRLSIL